MAAQDQKPDQKPDVGQGSASPVTAEAGVPATTEPEAEETREITGATFYGGVSWEEVRKGQPPKLIKNPDQQVWDDRYTSQMMIVNMTGGRWRPLKPIFKPE